MMLIETEGELLALLETNMLQLLVQRQRCVEVLSFSFNKGDEIVV